MTGARLQAWLFQSVLVGALVLVVLSFSGLAIPSLALFVFAGAALLSVMLYTIGRQLGMYMMRRLGQAVFALFLVATLTFLLLRLLPGGPFDQEKTLSPEVLANIEAKYQLNAPLYVQYLNYLKSIATGHFGESYKYIGRSVGSIIGQSLPASFQLGIFSLLVAYLIGIPLGVFAAGRHNRWSDHVAMFVAISGVSLPSFLVGPVLILIFGIWVNWLPVALWEGPEYYILPVLTLGLRPAAVIARLTRANVLDVIGSDFVRTARAKGLAESVVLYRHVLKNSLIPVLSFSGPLVAGVLSGSFVIELIFNVPGIAKHFVQSVSNRDYPLILGVTFLFSALLIFANLLVDILYSYFDPRIQLE